MSVVGRKEVTGANVLVALFSNATAMPCRSSRTRAWTVSTRSTTSATGKAKVPAAPAPPRQRLGEENGARPRVKQGNEALRRLLRRPQPEGREAVRSADRPRHEVERTIQVLCRRTKNNRSMSASRRRKTAIAEAWRARSSGRGAEC